MTYLPHTLPDLRNQVEEFADDVSKEQLERNGFPSQKYSSFMSTRKKISRTALDIKYLVIYECCLFSYHTHVFDYTISIFKCVY